MLLSEFKSALSQVDQVRFTLPNGQKVPAHYHITEVGLIEKSFIDCGGTVRSDQAVNLQLWVSIDLHHRLKSEKVLKILDLSEEKLKLPNAEIEVEYQQDTIGKFGLAFDGQSFQLTANHTDCLAKSECGVNAGLKQIKEMASNCCSPGGGCC